MKAMVTGVHRRQRPPAHRPAWGAAWAGLFLLLFAITAVASRSLWSGLAADLFRLGQAAPPQGLVAWQTSCSMTAACSLALDGKVLLAEADPGEGGEAPTITLRQVESGRSTAILSTTGALLALDSSEPGLVAVDGAAVPPGTWRLVLARARQVTEDDPGGDGGVASGLDREAPAGGSSSGFLLEEAVWLEQGGSQGRCETSGGVLTSALAWLDDATIAAALYYPGNPSSSSAAVLAIGPDGGILWSHDVGRDPLHRLASRSGTGLIAAASPDSVTLLDGNGNLLWTKSVRDRVVDLGLQSHGGPAVIAGDRLLAFDRRGNLLWRKNIGQAAALACLGNRIAVATEQEIVVYDEDGLERWSLACAGAPLEVAVDSEGKYVAIILETGTLVLVQAPGYVPVGGSPRESRGGTVL